MKRRTLTISAFGFAIQLFRTTHALPFVYSVDWVSAPSTIPNGSSKLYTVKFDAVTGPGETTMLGIVKDDDLWLNPDDEIHFEPVEIPAEPGYVHDNMSFELQCIGGKVHGTTPRITIGHGSDFISSGEGTAEIFVVFPGRNTSTKSVKCT